MLKSCQYCGRIHPRDFNCGKKPVRSSRTRDERESGRYSRAFSKKSREVKERSNYLCAVCLKEGRLSYDGLETHHIRKLTEAPELLLEDSNLICLCRRHHEMADAGLIDADELRGLAAERDEGSPGGGALAERQSPATTRPPK